MSKTYIVLGVVVFLCLMFTSYNIGRQHGMFMGIYGGLNYYNISVCDLLNDVNPEVGFIQDNGDCLITNNTKYNTRADCYFGSFVTYGEKDMNIVSKILYNLNVWLYLGC